MTSLPLLFAQPNWFTSTFIAARLGIPHRTVQYWCLKGFLTRRGCTIATIAGGTTKHIRYWIRIPLVTKDAILRRVPLDTPSLKLVG